MKNLEKNIEILMGALCGADSCRTGRYQQFKEKLYMEKETIGLYLSGHPLDEYQDVIKDNKIGRAHV